MDVIKERALRFTKRYFSKRVPPHKYLLEQLDQELSLIAESLDKIRYINIVIEGNNESLKRHRLHCKNNPDCDQDFETANINFFLNQMLQKLGVYFEQDAFTSAERNETETILDKILSELRDIKIGQQIIIEEVEKEISDLRELFFLGKRKWHQLFLGKCMDMVAGGVVSETVSKKIIEDFSKSYQMLIT